MEPSEEDLYDDDEFIQEDMSQSSLHQKTLKERKIKKNKSLNTKEERKNAEDVRVKKGKPRIQSSKIYNRTPQILGNKPIKLKQNQVNIQMPSDSVTNMKSTFIRQNSTAAPYASNTAEETIGQQSLVRTVSKRKFKKEQRRFSANQRKQQELVFDPQMRSTQNNFKRNIYQPQGYMSTNLIVNQSIETFQEKRPPSGKKMQKFKNAQQFDGLLDSLFSKMQKPESEIRKKVAMKYDIKINQIQYQKQMIKNQIQEKQLLVTQNLQKVKKTIENIKIKANIEIKILQARDFNQDLSKIYKEWIFSIIIDTEKNIQFAKNKMLEQRKEMIQSQAYARKINQLEVLDNLLQQQENLPILNISKMKRGKGLKNELREFLNCSPNYEYELIAIIRKKPYIKKSQNQTYRKVWKNANFPPLNILLQNMVQIIGEKKEKINVQLIQEQVSKKLKKLHLKPQNIEIQKLEKLEQIIQNKSLKIFQEPENDFCDVRVYRSDGQICKIKDLIQTKIFSEFFSMDGSHKVDQNLKLFINEKPYDGGAIKKRFLTDIEICFLLVINLFVVNDSNLQQKLLEIKINQNSNLFAHKFKNKKTPTQLWQQQFQNQEFVLISQLQDGQIFKQFLVQIKSNKQPIMHEFGTCCWPSCTKKTIIQPIKKQKSVEESDSRNLYVSNQNTQEKAKKKRRPDSSYKKHATSGNQLYRKIEKLSKLPFQLNFELSDNPLMKIIKKYQNVKQSAQEKDIIKQKLQLLNDKRIQRQQGQITQNNKRMPQIQAISMCEYHQGHIIFIRSNYGDNPLLNTLNTNQKLACTNFWRIISNENYSNWKLDLRGCLLFEVYTGELKETFKKLAQNVLNKISQPSIAPIIECLENQPQSLGILEQYILWIQQFVNKLDKKLLLIKNQNYDFSIKTFKEQANIFQENINQALINEKQISEVLRSKLIFTNNFSLDQVLKQKAMLRALYPRIYELISSQVPQSNIVPFLKNQQDVFSKFAKFQLILDYFTQFDHQKLYMKNVQSSSGFKQIQQIYSKGQPLKGQLPEIQKNLELKPFQSPVINNSKKPRADLKLNDRPLTVTSMSSNEYPKNQLRTFVSNNQSASNFFQNEKASKMVSVRSNAGNQPEVKKRRLSNRAVTQEEVISQKTTQIEPPIVNFYQSETEEQKQIKKLRYQNEKVSEQSEKYLYKVQEIYKPNQILLKKSRAHSMKKNNQQLTIGNQQPKSLCYPLFNSRQPHLTGARRNQAYVRNMSSNINSQHNPVIAKPVIAKKPRPITSGGVSLINRELETNEPMRKSLAFVTATNGFYPAVKMNNDYR